MSRWRVGPEIHDASKTMKSVPKRTASPEARRTTSASHDPSRRVTINDVARACKVAPSTVSNALAGKAYVKPATRRRILAAVERLGYRASTIARALRTQRSFSVGVVLADITNPTFPEIVRGIEDALRASGCTLLLCNTDGSVERQAQYMRALADRHVDGLILVSQHLDTPAIEPLLATARPSVLVHRRHRRRTFDYVGLDNVRGITLALEHLTTLRHRRIAFIRGPQESTAVEERYGAFAAFVAAGRIDDDACLVVQGDYTREGGYAAGEILLDLPHPPSAIIASNDVAALGVLEAARERRLEVPRDVSIVGFDDIFVSGLNAISLTTVRQPMREIGAAAAQLLLKRITDGKHPYRAKQIVFAPDLVVRRTTAPPASRSAAAPGSSSTAAANAPRLTSDAPLE
jgi:LacI family transcriptional regulator, galactose operon repressor